MRQEKIVCLPVPTEQDSIRPTRTMGPEFFYNRARPAIGLRYAAEFHLLGKQIYSKELKDD